MTRYAHPSSHAQPGDIESRPRIEGLIRPGLLKAFPLPERGHHPDERFERLLDALAGRIVGHG